MIIDKLENLSAHFKDQNLANAISEFLSNASSVPAGKHDIVGETFANVLEYATKPFEKVKMEAHVKYLDLQYMVRGEEIILHLNKGDNAPINEYNPDKDVVHYSPSSYDAYALEQGNFAIMYPEDLHQCIAKQQPENIKKIVVKIPVEAV